MNAAFELSHDKLAEDPKFAELARELAGYAGIDSRASFNNYARKAIELWSQHFGAAPAGRTSRQFDDLLEQVKRGGENVIQTPWGGVVVTLHEHPRVEKYLVIRKGGYLALETHEQKDERLEVKEGAGIILFRHSSAAPLTAQALAPGNQFHFEPGMEHCIIGTENLLVFERSIDPKGMDQDLVFIYEPNQS